MAKIKLPFDIKSLKVVVVPIGKVLPYANNARLNDDAVPGVVKSIKTFGFTNPVLCEKDGTIIAGHTRVKAAQSLGMTEVPVIYFPHLTKKQAAALRLVDNKLQEMSSWDFDKLDKELAAISEMDGDALDMGDMGFPSLDDDPFGAEDTAPAGEAEKGVAAETQDGAAVAGVGGTLPPELAGKKLTPDEQEKIDVEAPTNKERVIIVFDPGQRKELLPFFGFVPDKVVYTIEEIMAAAKGK